MAIAISSQNLEKVIIFINSNHIFYFSDFVNKCLESRPEFLEMILTSPIVKDLVESYIKSLNEKRNDKL